MRVLVTGITGQDGSFLAELLLSQGHEVFGIVRRQSVVENQTSRINAFESQVKLFYGDLQDKESLCRAIRESKPDEIYNLGAQSHVRISFDLAHYTSQVNAIGVLNMLEATREYAPNARFYQASSSEMFGASVDKDGRQSETTPMNPVSPYGCAKLFAYNHVRHARRAYGMFAVNGILFNHESSRRGANFVTMKVVRTACEIAKGMTDKLVMGNLNSKRDWGYAKEYVEAMTRIVRHDQPDDFVIATGQTHSIQDLVERVFQKLNLEWRRYVVQDSRYMRAEELPYLCGNAEKAKKILHWEPKVSYEILIDGMVDIYMAELEKRK